jgi:hypothetical protein
MKKLLFVISLLAFFTQCKKNECGVTTYKVSPLFNSKSASDSVPISYNNCEYVVNMPQNSDSFDLKKALAGLGVQVISVSATNGALQKWGWSSTDGGTIKPPCCPHPIVQSFTENSLVQINTAATQGTTTQTRSLESPSPNAPNQTNDIGFFEGLSGINEALSKGVKVINVNWRVLSDGNPNWDKSLQNVFKSTLDAVVRENVLLIVSVGDDGLKFGELKTDAARVKSFPAFFTTDKAYASNIISVGAFDTQNNTISTFSNEDNYVDIYASGNDVARSYIPHSTNSKDASPENSTVHAAPYVTRLAAALHDFSPCTPWSEIKQFIMSNSKVVSMKDGHPPVLVLDEATVLCKKNLLKKCK